MMIALETKLNPFQTGMACAAVTQLGAVISYRVSPILGTSVIAAGIAGMWRSWKSKETGVEPKVIYLDMAQAAIFQTLLKKIEMTALSKLKSGACTAAVYIGDFLYNQLCEKGLLINRSPDPQQLEDKIYEYGAPLLIRNLDLLWK